MLSDHAQGLLTEESCYKLLHENMMKTCMKAYVDGPELDEVA